MLKSLCCKKKQRIDETMNCVAFYFTDRLLLNSNASTQLNYILMLTSHYNLSYSAFVL